MTPLKDGSLPAGRQGFAHPAKNVGAMGIEPGMTVADFGAGSGHYIHAIASRLANSGHVYAIDIQQDLLTRIKNDAHKRGYKNVEIIWSDLEQAGGSKIADRHVDRVLISNLLFQVPDKTALFAEAWRILKPGGQLVIVDWTESFGGMGPHKNEVVSKDQALELARANGFELVREFNAGAHHYGIVCKPAPKIAV